MKRQHGSALLLMFVVLFLMLTSAALARLPNPALRQREETRKELERAREALLAYAITYEDNYYDEATPPGPGFLPCPNLDLPTKDESPNPPCNGHFPIIGRLPRTFPMRSEVHEEMPAGWLQVQEFWYVLSRGFQNNRKPPELNTASRGRLTVDGEEDVVAVIFAPGAPLPGQHRPSTDPRDYLEGENADGDNDFTLFGREGNDQGVVITRAQFDTRVAQRVAGDLKRLLDRERDLAGSYPTELPAGLPAWFLVNWRSVTDYSSSGDMALVRFGGCDITFTFTRAAPGPTRDKASCG